MEGDIQQITERTLYDYERQAAQFFAATADHDVSQNIAALLDAIRRPAPLSLLDFGCGPGRDLKTFRSLGHHAIGLDGCAPFVEMARAHSGCDVWHQNFAELALPQGRFDGIFANASLFHVPGRLLPKVLGELFEALTPGGVLFSSNPRGNNVEGWQGTRYGGFWDYPAWEARLVAAGFVPVNHYYRPQGAPPEQQRWLASVWRRPG
jgi:SAM-dependent methyltransferase